MALHIESAKYHRNGVSGAGYTAVRFRVHVDGCWQALGAVVFDLADHVAILDDAGQSWRCEDFQNDLRAFIRSPLGERMIWGDYALCSTANEA